MSHCFTLKHKGLANILLTPLTFSIPSVGVDNNAKFQTQCIWDTGCSKTTITKEVVDALGLVSTGFDRVNTASEINKLTTTYQVDLYLKEDLVFRNLTVNLGVILKGVGCLLGMDIIGQGDLSVTGLNGSTCMSFRFPSSHELDFVDEHNKGVIRSHTPVISGKISRNATCPCKSGKKYKNCHGLGQ